MPDKVGQASVLEVESGGGDSILVRVPVRSPRAIRGGRVLG
jgi:hypothetical protein